MPIQINLDKAKTITHDKRRQARASEFAPLDQEINISIANPAKVSEVEAKRQAIRDKYSKVQMDIDKASSVEELKNIISTFS